MGWYGKLPQPQAGPPLSAYPQMALDPTTALPFLLLGIKSYLTIESLLNFIDPSQPTFSKFLTEFSTDLQYYASFLYSQYQLAVNGILKSDIPEPKDFMSFFYFMVEVVYGASSPDNTQWWGGSYPYPGVPGSSQSWPYPGFAWNGIYGVVDAYPTYGAYQPAPPVAVPSSSPSYLIDIINTDNLVAEAEQQGWEGLSILGQWTLPWVQNRLMLGLMARWKAIYLIKGLDKAWSIIQNLRILANQSLLPTLTLEQDGTVADGNWSARELCAVLNVEGSILDGGPFILQDSGGATYYSLQVSSGGPYSLFALVVGLDNIANGNWAGPPIYSVNDAGLRRPLGFRDRLAAAAV